MTLKCKNIKFSVNLKQNLELSMLNCEIFEKHICFIIKNTFGVFTIYKHNKKKIHITGVKSRENIFKTFYFIKNKLNSSIASFKIDNSMFSCKQKMGLNRKMFKNTLTTVNHLYTTQIKYEIFPAVVLRPQPHLKIKGHPTILFFETGSYVFLGGTNIYEINDARAFIVSLINKCVK